jgi:hypothetical protein
MKHLNQIFLFLFFLITFSHSFYAKAQGFSYVYIQGDKKTPIYTKVEGVMMPRLGKNYALLSRLAPGPLNLEILFQQNEFPPIQFNILVPENSKRAFVLQNKEGIFSLYDIEQNFYLKPNNDISDDHLPTIITNNNIALEKNNEEKSVDSNNRIPSIIKTEKPIDTEVIASVNPTKIDSLKKLDDPISPIENIEKNTPAINPDSTSIASSVDSNKLKFIENIIFDNETNKLKDELSTNINEQKKDSSLIIDPAIERESTPPAILNSDCTSQISALNFLKLNNSISAKKTENEKLGLIIEAAKQNCFNTQQVQKMLTQLESDLAKFTAIKKLYPKTTDQANFPSLEALFVESEWKDHFKELLQNKP